MSNDLWVVGDRHAIRLCEVKSLKIRPHYTLVTINGKVYGCLLIVGGLATYLYSDEAAARVDFDKIIAGRETVRLSGAQLHDYAIKTNGALVG